MDSSATSKDDKLILERHKYYSNIPAMFEIVKNLVGREAVFLSKNKCWRCLKIHKLEFFNKNAKFANFWKMPYNIYYSLARLQDMPMFTFSRYERKPQQTQFNQEFNKYLVGYDFGLDFDGHDMELDDVKEDVNKIKGIFDTYGVAYELKFSGSGFHININNNKLPAIQDKPTFFKDIVNRIKVIFNLPSLDLGVYDTRRIWKCPYSYDVKTGNIALPLSQDQFKNFNLSMVKPTQVLQLDLYKRGNLERVGNPEGFTNFLEDFIFDDEEKIDSYV